MFLVHCAIDVVEPFSINVPFSLFLRLLIGRRDLTLREYVAASWIGLPVQSDVDGIILKYSRCVQGFSFNQKPGKKYPHTSGQEISLNYLF